MKIKDSIKKIYDDEIPPLIESLNSLSRDEREELYKDQTELLFPKSKTIVSLDCLISPRKDYEYKFKKTFLYVTNRMLSDYHLGEYNQDYFSRMTCTSYVYPQKVVMSLSLLGYIKGLRCNYSYLPNDKELSHGYVYSINKEKMESLWSVTDSYDNKDEETLRLSSEYESSEFQEWFVRKQFDTIMSITVGEDLIQEKNRHDEFIRNYIMEEDEVSDEEQMEVVDSDYEVETDIDVPDEKEQDNHPQPSYSKSSKYEKYKEHKYRSIDITNLLEKDIQTIGTFSIDDYSGRFHSTMTRIRNDIRLSGSLTINGDKIREVDISSSQPTLFGLLVKEEHPDLKSEWLNHCLSGDFYEWLIDVTGIEGFEKEELVKKIDKRNLPRHTVHFDSDDPHIYLRPIVKFWMMKMLFSSSSIKSLEKNTGSYYKTFTSSLCRYLEENEPHLYDKLKWYHDPGNLYREKHKKKSLLPKHLQQMEVRYIKECLKEIDPMVDKFYTIHDCIGCCEKDSGTVKTIMEQTSMRMFGVKLNLKIE